MEKPKSNQLKPAYQTLEGQIVAGISSIAGICIFRLTGMDVSDLASPQNIEKAMSMAKSAAEIAGAYRIPDLTMAQAIYALASTIKLGAVLLFTYKLIIRFSNNRSDLKKTIISKLEERLKHESVTPSS